MKVLVIDVGGTNVKLLLRGEEIPRKFESGPKLTAEPMVKKAKEIAADWKYEAVSIGYPGPVLHNRPLIDPCNLGKGWVGFPFRKAFGCSVKIMNDAAMQALGSYRKGKMLFLGLGTGLGTALVVDGTVEPMELGHLPYKGYLRRLCRQTQLGNARTKKMAEARFRYRGENDQSTGTG
jgi:polyphosphate glucokinase